VPRFTRLHVPGALVHVITRFVNRAFRLAGAAERALVLDAIPLALSRSDWRLFGFALMSSHVHLVMSSGDEPAWRFLKSLQTRVALRLNARHRAFGPVFAERATTILVRPERAGALLAYVHNNPVRAAVVLDPAATVWTSHRAYLGLDPVPSWLDVELGLQLAGFDDSPSGRSAFHQFVVQGSARAWDPELSSPLPSASRADLRLATVPLDTSSPSVGSVSDAMRVELSCGGPGSPWPRWDGSLTDLLRAACELRSVPMEQLRSPSQRRAVTSTRRLVIVAGHLHLRRRVNELAAALGIANSTASHLLGRAASVEPEARILAARIWANAATTMRPG